MENKNIIIIVVAVLIIGVLGFVFLNGENGENIPDEPIQGYGVADGSCNEDGSIFVQDESIRSQINTIEDNAGSEARCFADETTYAFSVQLPSETFWCIDSTGFSGEITQDITTSSCTN